MLWQKERTTVIIWRMLGNIKINKIVEESSKNINKIAKKVPCVSELDITSTSQMFVDYKKEAEITKRERRQAIDKFFEIIDKGIEENDRELIAFGLSSLSNVIASSLFSNIGELTKLIESGETIDL